MINNTITEDLIKKEKRRIKKALDKIDFGKTKMSKHIQDFVKNYFSDSDYFFEKKDYISAFEALIICWAYLDVGAKLKIIEIPKSLKDSFTV